MPSQPSDSDATSKKKLGTFLVSQITNFIFLIVFGVEAFGGPPKGTLRHWLVALLVIVLIGNSVYIVYLLWQKFGKRSANLK